MPLTVSESNAERYLSKIEGEIESLRARYEKVTEILGKHQQTAEAKKSRGEKQGITWKRIQAKRKEAGKLGSRIVIVEPRLEIAKRYVKNVRDHIRGQLEQPLMQEFVEIDKKDRKKVRSKRDVLRLLYVSPEHWMEASETGKYRDSTDDDIPYEINVIDPGRISEETLEKLGIADFDDAYEPYHHYYRKVKAIPRLIELFEKAIPLTKLTDDGPRDNFRLMAIHDFDPEHDGKILWPRYRGTKSEEEDTKILQIYSDGYSAFRKASYVDRGYEREVHHLSQAASLLVLALDSAKKIRKHQPGASHAKAVIQEQLTKACRHLETVSRRRGKPSKGRSSVKNFYKKQSLEILKQIRELKDSLGRENLLVTSKRLEKAVKLFQFRPVQVTGKAEAGYEDKICLLNENNNSEATLDRCFDALQQVCTRLDNARSSSAFDPKKRAGSLTKRVSEFVLEPFGNRQTGLNNAFGMLDRLKIRPFNLYAAKIKARIKALNNEIEKGNYNEATREAVKAFILTKIFKAQKEIEHVFRDISLSPSDTDLDYMTDQIEELYEVISETEVFPKVKVEAYEKAYQKIQRKIKSMLRGLKIYQKRRLGVGKRREMYHRLREFLEEFDFTEILEGLD